MLSIERQTSCSQIDKFYIPLHSIRLKKSTKTQKKNQNPKTIKTKQQKHKTQIHTCNYKHDGFILIQYITNDQYE